ncbi:MAG: alpha-L-rhamnosidase N-terminal domain-containing protein, partial [Ruthenibacterium sp.]
MESLRQHFITVNRPYKEGTVEVFEQPIAAAQVKRAVLDITALGVYEAQMNGKKIGDDFLAPGYTYYPHDLRCQRYDVTAQLTQNATLRVYLGQGWYCGRFTCDNKTQIYGAQPAVSWLLTVEHTDGRVSRFSSDDATVKSVQSPYGYAGMYDGEVYYAQGAVQAESQQPKPDAPLSPTRFTGKIPDNLCATTVPIRCHEAMPVKAVTRCDNATILDFGQNFAGI